jgi:hypothetical protein
MIYKAFYETFLAEMPQRANGANPFNEQLEMFRANLQYGADVIKVTDGMYKYADLPRSVYWMGTEDASDVSIIVDTEDYTNFRKVILTSKNPAIPLGSPPYATDMYLDIRDDSKTKGLTFTSDETMSIHGERLWKNLVKRGFHISVYDKRKDQFALTPVETENDLDEYLGGEDKKRFVFVLSESASYGRGLIHHAAIMDLKRKCGYPIMEMMTAHLRGN